MVRERGRALDRRRREPAFEPYLAQLRVQARRLRRVGRSADARPDLDGKG
ncbi:MAG TPA: hypothetical protein VGV40_05345 [Solirubrobacteraceae bacterium]|nr:hypothetical protein [Solirubrobacteraceae bacterium]